MPVHCPNCSALIIEEPARCERCGFEPALSGEYLWIYAGGSLVILLGFVVGAFGIVLEGVGPAHWSLLFEGWCPFAPWPRGSTWIGFLALGIALTGCGLGITRQKRPAWITLCALSLYRIVLAALAAGGLLGSLESSVPALAAIGIETLVLGLLLRIGLAFLRTPARGFSNRQASRAPSESAA